MREKSIKMHTLRTFKRRWEQTHQEKAERDMETRREYVSSKTRDGQMKPRSLEMPVKLGSCIATGARAEAKQVPRWANPYTAMRARAWTYGWEQAHTASGRCRGCDTCGAGTSVPHDTFKGWLRDRDFATGEYAWARDGVWKEDTEC